MKTKDKIIQTARTLFNQYGYWNVTIRMIASEMDISSGNLNYHYKKREDILEELYFMMVTEFDQHAEQSKETSITFKKVKEDIVKIMGSMMTYKFFWTDLYSLTNNFPRLHQHFSDAYQKRVGGYQFLFYFLKQKGFMKSNIEPNELRGLAERMIHFLDTWIYCAEIYNTDKSADTLEKQADKLLTHLYPYLTAEGKHKMDSLTN